MTGDHPERAGAVTLRGVRKQFGSVVAVDHLNLEISPGEFLTLLGPSGSGKTTILRLIAGFERVTAGEIILDGRDVSPLSPAKRGIGVVFQHYALFPHLTVADNIAYGLKVRRAGRAERDARVEEMLALVRLEGYGARYPRELSGGQQQRVAVARALAFNPRLLLMDEPLGALDRALRVDLEEELRRIHAQIGTTMIYVTHDQEEALAMSDRIAIMRQGQIVQIGRPEDLYEHPVETFVAKFLGECNLLELDRRDWPAGAVARLNAASGGQDGPAALGTAVIRPERMRLQSSDGDITISGTLMDRIYLGEVTRLRVSMGDGTRLTALVDPHQARDLRIADEVALSFSPDDAVIVGNQEVEG